VIPPDGSRLGGVNRSRFGIWLAGWLVACNVPLHISAEAGPQDASAPIVCKEYYAQAHLTSGACATCQNGACASERANSISACASVSDNQCFTKCQADAALGVEDCTCLEACITPACAAATEAFESCELGACGTSCK
jgi:hypothetical protein